MNGRGQERGQRQDEHESAGGKLKVRRKQRGGSRLIRLPLGPSHARAAAFDPLRRQTRADGPREHVQRHLAAPPPALDPDARAAHEAADERAPERPVPEVVRDPGEEPREDERAGTADGEPDGRHEGGQERRAARYGEQRRDEPWQLQQLARTRDEDGEGVHLRGGMVQYPGRCR